ncbi:MAG: hypothetical protein EPN20_06210 [Magnetospirillum sp.]|nr:MAG: hypothetical protein EPN20_06210 [Magnetospirillum sp.]
MPSGLIIIADTSVLINFLRIDRMDLIGAHSSGFLATEHVGAEISDSYADQQTRYRAALDAGFVIEERVDNPAEIELFLKLRRQPRLGTGECSAISVAINRDHALAMDDNRAINHALQEAGLARRHLRIIRTQDILADLARAGVLSIKAADAILAEWAANHRFRTKISSIGEIL